MTITKLSLLARDINWMETNEKATRVVATKPIPTR